MMNEQIKDNEDDKLLVFFVEKKIKSPCLRGKKFLMLRLVQGLTLTHTD